MCPNSTTRTWFAQNGRAVLTLENGVLVKLEKSKDRLRIMSNMGHAVDEQWIAEAVSLGARILEIHEDGAALIWRAELETLPVLRRKICGTLRRVFDLRDFDLVRGTPPAWYRR